MTRGTADIPRRLSRRDLFGLTGTTVGLAGLLAACGSDSPTATGRVGLAPTETAPPDEPINDIVYLRTVTSLDHTIIDTYDQLSGLDGVDEALAALIARFQEEHTATADDLAEVTSAVGGEPYQCANAWLMRRTIQPALDHVVGVEDEIPPSDDPARDALALVYAVEAMYAATGQLYAERIVEAEARAAVIGAGTRASQRAAVAAIRITPPPEGYVSPDLLDPEAEVQLVDGLFPRYAVPSHFGQVTPIDTIIGAADENDQRYTVTLEPPAENGYIYESQSCPAVTETTSG